MTQLEVDFEGHTNGTAFTTANSNDFGDAQCTVTPGGETLVIDTSDSFIGTRSLRLTVATGTNATLFDIDDSASSALFSHSFYIKVLAYPSVTNAQIPIGIRSTSAAIGRLEMSTTGQLRIIMGGNGTYSTPVLSLNTWYRVNIYGSGLGTSDTDTFCDVYVGNNTGTPHIAISLLNQTTAVQGQRTRIGKIAASPNATFDCRLDSIVANYGTSTPQAPRSNNVAPTANAGTDQTNVEAYTTVTIDGSGSSDSDGTIVSYNWSVLSTTNGAPTPTLSGSGATRTFKAPGAILGTDVTCRLNVTDDDGATSSNDDVVISVLPVTERYVVGGVEVPLEVQVQL